MDGYRNLLNSRALNNKPTKKKRKLEPLIDWGENRIGTEQGIIPREWFLTSLEEENELELDLNIEVDWKSKLRPEGSKKMKQLEIDFSKTIVSNNKEDEKLESESEVEETIPDGRKCIQDCDEGVTGVDAPGGPLTYYILLID